MAAFPLTLSPLLRAPGRFPQLQPSKARLPKTWAYKKSALCASSTPETTERRSANYHPTVWDNTTVLTLSSTYSDGKFKRRAEKLTNDVKDLINKEVTDEDLLANLELIDAVQRLGLEYHFKVEIKNALDILYHQHANNAGLNDDDLYAMALQFRLFRQHGFNVSPDVFRRFKDETGNFKPSICSDTEGLLSMYEASFLGFEGETIMDEAKAFSTRHLKDLLRGNMSRNLHRKVVHSLEVPLHWRLNRVEARWFIDTYEQEPDVNPTLLELAKLDYNILQSIYQEEVKQLSRWWEDAGINKQTFARDRLLEHYLWNLGLVYEPEYVPFRIMKTKIVSMITAIDDVFDVYGSLEELELLTDFVDRWDITGIDKLPDPIRLTLMVLYNSANEIGHWTIKEKGFNVISYLSKAWADLCKAYLREAKWFNKGYKPTLEEYLQNAVVSISTPLMMIASYFLTTDTITKEALDYIDKLPTIVHSSAMIIRLNNDLGTSPYELARGDNLKAVECYMNETGATEEVAREHLVSLVHQTWKKMNKAMLQGDYPFSEPFLGANPNLARGSHFFYNGRDGHGISNSETREIITKLLVEPVPVKQALETHESKMCLMSSSNLRA